MSLLNRFTLNFTARSAGTYTNGFFAPSPPPAQIVALGNLQPADSKELLSLPEGRRNKDTLVFYTKQALDTTMTTVISGRTYDVASVATWQQGGLAHYKLLLQAVENA